ncbi:MAG: class A beta-lactamase [Methylobacteriaceae bacterium]|nr:class A beta-lactamase [Methylobacteriaceae bacterium]
MSDWISRRAALVGAAVCISAPSFGEEPASSFAVSMRELESRHGGRLGVAVADTASGLRVGYRADEAFPLCSTFKFLAAAAILARADAKSLRLDQHIAFGESDLDSYSPVTKRYARDGSMPLAEICAAAMIWSDNTAGNLMLRELGGPAALTSYVRSLGDAITRLDRTEPDLNSAIPEDPRDTAHPRVMVEDMQQILLGPALSASSRDLILSWMVGSQTGGKRIRSGLPPEWRAGDKTGTGENATANDIAIAYPPSRKPILVAAYYTGPNASREEQNAIHAEIGRAVAALV